MSVNISDPSPLKLYKLCPAHPTLEHPYPSPLKAQLTQAAPRKDDGGIFYFS